MQSSLKAAGLLPPQSESCGAARWLIVSESGLPLHQTTNLELERKGLCGKTPVWQKAVAVGQGESGKLASGKMWKSGKMANKSLANVGEVGRMANVEGRMANVERKRRTRWAAWRTWNVKGERGGPHGENLT